MNKKEQIKYWSMTQDQAFSYFNSEKTGLKSGEAAERLKTHGENVIKEQQRTSELMLFINQFKNPIIIILIIATLISAVTGEIIDASIILVIILASAVLSFLQEYSASNAIKELRAKVQVKSVIMRDGEQIEVSAKEIVPGDIIKLSAGSLIPADGIIIESLNLFVNQSILTGESLPSEKKEQTVSSDSSIEERLNCVYMGTSVHSGTATMLVAQTGINTEFGKIAEELNLRPPETDFERGVRHFGYMLTQIMLVLTLAVFAINVIFKRPAIDSLLFSVALAVGITPQLLPAIISITLSKGSRTMAKEGVIVRKLNAIENFGSMDVLCTDKTGTLTEGVIRVDGAADIYGESSADVFRMAYINASLQSGMTNSLDEAISKTKNIDISDVIKKGEIPFDFTRERLSVAVIENNQPVIIAKGALNSILSVCSYAQAKTGIVEIDENILKQINEKYSAWSNEGIRVLGVSKKQVDLKDAYEIEDESAMIFLGFLLLFDHPKKNVFEVIDDLDKMGVSLRIITGDNKLIALNTAQKVGLKVAGVLTGGELMKLSDEALWNKIENTNLFVEVDPNQKERIILALKKKSHVVGYMGDGINDVPALHAADVSISVDNAVDVAKQSADFVILEKKLEVLKRGIVLGRTTFANTLKYIQVTTSANFGNMFSMAGASLFLPFLPLMPKQILLINFLSDFPAITIANDVVDEEILQKPRKWDIKFIRDFMFTFGFISSLFDYITFFVLFIVFNADQEQFQTGWFTLSIWTELLILMVMRTHKPFFKSRPAPVLLYSSIAVGIITFIIPYMPFHQILNVESIDPVILVSLVLIAAIYIIVTEIGKHYFYRSRL